MHWKIVRTLEEFNLLKESWNYLLSCSASHVPFLRHEYLATWWKTLGGGEWAIGEMLIALAYHEDGTLAGAAPLFHTTNRDQQKALMLIGSIEISDYLDIIVCQEDLPGFIQELLPLLVQLNSPAWEVLDFYNILDASPTLPVLRQAAQNLGWQVHEEPLQHCPYIPLPGDWETYLSAIDKKQRHEIRRKMRRADEWAQEGSEPVRWYIVEDSASLNQEMDDFMDLMAQDPDKAKFLSPVMRTQMQLAARAAFDNGWLQLAFLAVGDTKNAGYLNFDYEGHIWVYNSGINYEARELSPGWVLLGHLLKWANEHQRSRFDFMRGDEDYKHRFGGIDRRVVRIKISRSG
jgi:CelD/BcsL family acetyltransferase involved in cellulose biosynthesis